MSTVYAFRLTSMLIQVEDHSREIAIVIHRNAIGRWRVRLSDGCYACIVWLIRWRCAWLHDRTARISVGSLVRQVIGIFCNSRWR